MTNPPKKYAQTTRVTLNRSRDEIERELARHGASAFAYAKKREMHAISFELGGRRVVFSVPLPGDEAVLDEAARFRRSQRKPIPRDVDEALEIVAQQRWRALLLLVKGKLEAVASGIVTVDEEFLTQTVMPDGRTVGQWALPQIARAYQTGTMPPMLPGAGSEE